MRKRVDAMFDKITFPEYFCKIVYGGAYDNSLRIVSKDFCFFCFMYTKCVTMYILLASQKLQSSNNATKPFTIQCNAWYS